MTLDEITKKFDTPSQLLYNKLRLENEILQKHISSNSRQMAQLHPLIEKEGNTAADRLDKDFPDWRSVLSKAYIEIKAKTKL